VDEQSFLRGMTELPLIVSRAARAIEPLDHTDLGEQSAHAGGFGTGQRQVVRAPGIRGDRGGACAGIAACARFELEHHHVAYAGGEQMARRRQSRHAGADHDGIGAAGRARGRRYSVAQQVAEACPVANDAAFDGDGRDAPATDPGGGGAGEQGAAREAAVHRDGAILCHSAP
jgi:hypothetical protein